MFQQIISSMQQLANKHLPVTTFSNYHRSIITSIPHKYLMGVNQSILIFQTLHQS